MNIEELIQSPISAQSALKQAIRQQSHVSLPGIIRSFDPSTQTAAIIPAIRDKDGGKFVDIPLLTDVPVYFPGGKDSAMTFPVAQGDECLVVFSDANIDSWYNTGDVSNPDTFRRHDLSDGFAFVGFRSRRNALKQFSSDPSFFGSTPGGGSGDMLKSTYDKDNDGIVDISNGLTDAAKQAVLTGVAMQTDIPDISNLATKEQIPDVSQFEKAIVFDVAIPSGSASVVVASDPRIDPYSKVVYFEPASWQAFDTDATLTTRASADIQLTGTRNASTTARIVVLIHGDGG